MDMKNFPLNMFYCCYNEVLCDGTYYALIHCIFIYILFHLFCVFLERGLLLSFSFGLLFLKVTLCNILTLLRYGFYRQLVLVSSANSF